jgi:hypothetical protein
VFISIPEECVKFHLSFISAIIFVIIAAVSASAQVDTVIGQITNSNSETFIGGVSGDGRFVVFESRGDLATENPRNADGNLEIFLFDYAQRRIFQITDTKSVLYDDQKAATFDNIRVDIVNTRPVISNDGKWIAFSSNATTSIPLVPDSTNPGSFNGNAFTSPTPTPTPTPSPTPTPTVSPTPTPGTNPLTSDGNLEVWLYQIPNYAPVADLSVGDELPVTNLSGGTFIPVTNTDPSQLPRAGTTTTGPFIADDNHDASISDEGGAIAFVSTRNLVPAVGNASPDVNDEIFSYIRASAVTAQITKTPRGVISNPIYNKNVTISGNGGRVVFASTGENPVVGFPSCGSNPVASRNEEIFYANLDPSSGAPTLCKQVTTTTPTNTGDPVNILDLGRRMSRDGRYIAFDSYADLAGENSGTNYTSFALYLYDTTINTFKRIGPRSDADSGAGGGDIAHYPGFTDTDGSGTPSTLVLETRENIKADGTIPSTASDGLNPDTARPAQLYYVPLPPATTTFTRAAKFPAPNTFLASTQPIPTNSIKRLVFNLALTELGTGNSDLQSEAFYLIDPTVSSQAAVNLNFATGATALPITPSVSPSPSPTQQPTPTPTPTPTPSPSPTPITPASVTGMSPGMLGLLTFDVGADQPITARTAVGSFSRRFNLPLELSGLTMTINGLGCGLKSVSPHQIVFVVPPFISSANEGTIYDFVINNNGAVIKGKVTIVPTRPDIFRSDGIIGPGGRAKLFNVTNHVHTTEPFTVTTVKIKGGVRVPTVLRLYATGVANATPSVISIRIGGVTMTATAVTAGGDLGEPGVYTIDFALLSTLDAAGDQPVVLSVNSSGTVFQSRVDDTTSFVRIL